MEILLTIISIFVGAILSFFISRYYYKKQMTKKEITHFLIKTYDIGKGLKDVFPEFNISYNNEDLAKYVRVYEGFFRNTGYYDVCDNENISIKMFFPKNCVVKAIKVKPTTGDLLVEPKFEEKDNEVQFVMGRLFKSKQSFEYIAIVESSVNIGDSSDDLTFYHMLPDTVILDGNKQFDASEQDFKRFLNWSMYITLFCGLFFILFAFLKGKEYPILHVAAPIILVLYCLLIYVYKLHFSRKMRNVLS